MGLRMSLPNVVGVSVGILVRQVAVHAWPLVVGVLNVDGWDEVAGFDD